MNRRARWRCEVAEGVGFEPTEAFTSHAFEACPFGRSGILPFGRLAVGAGIPNRQTSFKNLYTAADTCTVDQCDLFPDQPLGVARPGWQIIEAARALGLTAALTLHATLSVRVFLRDGEVYLAERCDAAPLSMRLQTLGVLSRDQAQRGVMLVNGTEHLGRLFERDTTIDRDAVELCIEVMTDEALTSIASVMVASHEVAVYQRHPSGIDRWAMVGAHDARTTASPTVTPATATPATATPTTTPSTATPPAATPPTAAATPPVTASPMQPALPMQPMQPTAARPASLLGASLTNFRVYPSIDSPAPIQGADDSLSIAIADEVAEAVRRALAAIDAAALPPMTLNPADCELPLYSTST